jgi:deoxyadenosine/deoxycytidine kinase
MAIIPVLLLTGPVGVGKSTVAGALSTLLNEAGVAHAVIDLDWLRWLHPSPPHAPFHIGLGWQNLAAVWHNYRRAGADRLILIDIVETRAALTKYQAAIPGAAITLVRLQATLPTLRARLEQREIGPSLTWHQQRAEELMVQMERDAVEDLRLNTEGKTVVAVAREILQQTRWIQNIPRRNDSL